MTEDWITESRKAIADYIDPDDGAFAPGPLATAGLVGVGVYALRRDVPSALLGAAVGYVLGHLLE